MKYKKETLKEMVRRIIKEETTTGYTESDLKFVDGKAIIKKGNKILAKIFYRPDFYKTFSKPPGYNKSEPYSLEITGIGQQSFGNKTELLQFLNKYVEQ